MITDDPGAIDGTAVYPRRECAASLGAAAVLPLQMDLLSLIAGDLHRLAWVWEVS